MTSFLEKKKIVKFSFGQEVGGGGGGVAIDFIPPTRTLNIFLQTLLNSANESLLSNWSTVYRVFIAKHQTSWHCDTNIEILNNGLNYILFHPGMADISGCHPPQHRGGDQDQ